MEESSWKKTCNQAFVIIGAIAGLITLIVAIIAYRRINAYTGDYVSVVNSWQTNPVTDIQFLPGDCPSTHRRVTASWGGTYDMCWCPSTSNETTSETSSCSSGQLSANCENIRSIYPPVTLDVFPSWKLCQRTSGESALERSKIVDGKCTNDNEKICGDSTQQYCFPKTEKCPITDIYISPAIYIDATENITAFNDNGVQYFIYLKRNGTFNITSSVRAPKLPLTHLPITDLSFDRGYPCTFSGCGYSRSSLISKWESNYKSSHSDSNGKPTSGYRLRQACEGGCSAVDSSDVSPNGLDVRYYQVYNISERKLLSAYSQIPSEFIPSPSDDQYPLFLSIRSEIEWSADCKRSREDVQSKKDSIVGVRTIQLVLLILSIFSFIILTICFPIQECKNPQWSKENKKATCCTKVLFKLATLSLTITTIVIAFGLNSFWRDINNFDCSDKLTTENFQRLGNIYKDLSYSNVIGGVSMGFTSVLDFFEQSIRMCC